MTQGKLPWRQCRKNHISPKRPFSLTLSDALSPIFSTTKSWLSASHWPSIVFGAHATCSLKFISPDQWINAGKWLKVRSLSFETSNISLKVKISVVEMCVIPGLSLFTFKLTTFRDVAYMYWRVSFFDRLEQSLKNNMRPNLNIIIWKLRKKWSSLEAKITVICNWSHGLNSSLEVWKCFN